MSVVMNPSSGRENVTAKPSLVAATTLPDSLAGCNGDTFA
jgi:hypothetical protein